MLFHIFERFYCFLLASSHENVAFPLEKEIWKNSVLRRIQQRHDFMLWYQAIMASSITIDLLIVKRISKNMVWQIATKTFFQSYRVVEVRFPKGEFR